METKAAFDCELREGDLSATFGDSLNATRRFATAAYFDTIANNRKTPMISVSAHAGGRRFDLRASHDALSNKYYILLTNFIEKYSLRYDLRRPCQLCPTLPGVFAGLVRELQVVTASDAHLDALMKEFESAIRDLRADSSEGKIKTCIQKQVNLLEAVGGKCPGVTEGELGKICNQLNNWPHAAVKGALKNLYGFTSDYPGIRHGGNAAGVLRKIEMRDMVAMCILLTGFSPYLTDQFNAEQVYRGT